MNLQIIKHENQLVVDSRQVAELVEKQHKDLMRDIRNYIKFMEKTGERKIAPSDFFIESTYTNSQNKQQPCYLLTKKGCDMVANKMTGEKGVIFTATYIQKFYEMEQQLRNRPSSDDVLQNKLRIFKELSRDCTTKQQIRMRIVALKETQAETGKDYSEVIEILSERPDPPILVNTVTPDKIQRVLEIIRNTESIGTVSNGYIYIESPKFTQIMIKMGYDRRLILKKMFAMGLLRIGMDGVKRYTIKKRMNGCILSCVAIKWRQ